VKDGCKLCECNPCPTVDCSATAGVAACPSGLYVFDDRGCKTCNCKPEECFRDCPYGNIIRNDGTRSCDCACPNITASCYPEVDKCAYGLIKDLVDGCPQCVCAPPPVDVCTKVLCDRACPNNLYKTDDKGCLICECRDPPVCKDVASLCPTIKCAYGFAREADGCESCTCNPCPKIDCTRICVNGFKLDATTNCPVCYCRETPTCDVTVGTVASTSADVPCNALDCKYGFVVKAGCKVCACNPAPPCECNVADRISSPVKCGDGSIRDYDTCRRDEVLNVCKYIRRECPVGIELKMSTGTFTSADLEKFRESLRVDIADIKFTVEARDGKQVVVFWIEREALPAATKDTDVAKSIETSVREDGSKNGVAYVISENPTGKSSSATIIVSLLLLVLVILA
jgi:hypothetical protein